MADQMFPNSRINNPYALAQIGPDAVAQQYKTQMQQRLADMLMMDGQQQPQGQMVSGHYVAPSPFQYLSGLASTGLGVAAYNQIPEQQAQYAQALRQQARGEANRLTGNAQMTNPQASSAALANGGGPTNSNAQTMQSYQGGQSAPLSGIDPNVVADILINGGPTQLAEFIRGVNMPTDTLKNYRAAGMSPQQIAQAISGKATADTAIDGGKWIQGQNGLEFVPDMKNGIYGGMKNGVPQVFPIPGYAGANATIEGAKADAVSRAQAGNKVTTVATGPNQTKQLVTEAQAIDAATGGKPMPVEPDSKTQNAGDIETYIDQANKLLGNASSGFFSKLGTAATDTVGISTDKSKADAQLKVVSGNLVLKMPRMEGPQSDADRKLYQSMAADVANPDIPIASRQAALKTLQELNNKYLPQSQQGGAKAPTPDSSGIYKPKTKAEYDAIPSGSKVYNSKGQLVTKP